MLELIQEMIHENNIAPAEGIAEEKIARFEERYISCSCPIPLWSQGQGRSSQNQKI